MAKSQSSPRDQALRELEFLELVYPPGAESSPDLYRHPGIEMLLVLRGEFRIHVGFEEYFFSIGDSMRDDPRLRAHVAALADPETGLAVPNPVLAGRPWQEPDVALHESGRTDLHESIDTSGRTSDRRDDFDSV